MAWRNFHILEYEVQSIIGLYFLFIAIESPACHSTTIMAISILPPTPAAPYTYQEVADDASLDSEGDVDMAESARPAKKVRLSPKGIVTPGESITEDPQWMRCSSPNPSTNPPSSANRMTEAMVHLSHPTPPIS